MNTTPDPLIGRKLGNFLVQEKVGSGGMGTVYRAIQEGLDRPVAIKVLHQDRGGQSTAYMKRFVREARSAAQISHPNVVQVYTAGITDGVQFIAMEFLEGASVGDLLDRLGSLPEARAVPILRQSALGLQAAERRGLVHRDVKPDNLMITRDGVVKVTDFGLAKDTNAKTRLTQEGVTIGTIAYMSPEQVRGEEVDSRSDIYSLGATVFHMVAGRPPFIGEGAVVLAYKQLNESPPMLREVNPELSPTLEAIVHRMIAKDPAQRYQEYQELLDDIDSMTSTGRPSSSQTIELHDRLLREAAPAAAGRGALAAAAGAGILLLLAVVLAVSYAAGAFGSKSRNGPAIPPPDSRPAPVIMEHPKNGALLKSARVEVSGRADPGQVLSIEVNGVRATLVGGAFRQEIWLDQAAPAVVIKASLYDGRVIEDRIAVEVDSEPPAISIESPAGRRASTRERSVRITGAATDPRLASIEVDGAAVTHEQGRFSIDVPAYDDERLVEIVAADRAGNVSAVSVKVVRDTAPPKILLHNFRKFVEAGDGVEKVVFSSDEPLSSLSFNGETMPAVGKLFEAAVKLAEGVNAILIKAVDEAGNATEVREEIRYKPWKPPTPDEMKAEFDETVRKALAADPEERIRILEEYALTHQGGPHESEARRMLEDTRKAVKSARMAQLLEGVKKSVRELQDPFDAIAVLKGFLEAAEGRAAEEASRILQELRAKDLPAGVLRSDEKNVYLNEKDGAQMMLVAGGPFGRGMPPAWNVLIAKHYSDSVDAYDESPFEPQLVIDPFFVYRHEVTNARFAAFLNETASSRDKARPAVAPHRFGLRQSGGKWVPCDGVEDNPAVCVTWFGAMEYSAWAGGSLPTEAQWEKAASFDPGAREQDRKRFFPWGDQYRQGAVNCADNYLGSEILSEVTHELFDPQEYERSRVMTMRVDSMPEGASACGCLHMAGNVWEWCLDFYDREFYKSRESKFRNPLRSKGGPEKVARGGSWYNMARDCRTTNRAAFEPARTDSGLGFRVVR